MAATSYTFAEEGPRLKNENDRCQMQYVYNITTLTLVFYVNIFLMQLVIFRRFISFQAIKKKR